MTTGRLAEEALFRGIIATLEARRFELTREQRTELVELLTPYTENDLDLEQAVWTLRGDGRLEAVAGRALAHLSQSNLLTVEEALAYEQQWREHMNELRRQRGEDVDPDGPPFGSPDDSE